MTPYECYQMYLSVKRHFTSNYSYFQYNGKVNASFDSFEKRKDRFFFQKMAKHTDPLGKTVANMLNDPKVWIRELAYSDQSEEVYTSWAKRVQAMRHHFKSDLSKLTDKFNDMLVLAPWETHPSLFKSYLENTVSIETLGIILMTTGAINRWDKDMKDDPLWMETSTKIRKYYPFLKLDEKVFKNIMIDRFSVSQAA
jgi:hypothetical protein